MHARPYNKQLILTILSFDRFRLKNPVVLSECLKSYLLATRELEKAAVYTSSAIMNLNPTSVLQ